MKKLIYIVKACLLANLLLFNFSCDQEEYLEEKPLDFYSLENSYKTLDNFENALTDIYSKVRDIHYGNEEYSNGKPDQVHMSHFYATDIAFYARLSNERFFNYDIWIIPTSVIVAYHWNSWYKVIANANTILSRLEESELTEDQKIKVAAEAKFFRGFAYRYLVYLYGGVPLNLEEITGPKTDFVRATKEETLNQIVSDLSDAARDLPSIAEAMDGKVSNLVAQHLLAETYISLGRYDDAIKAASVVIDDPNMGLMIDRFGTKANEDPQDDFLQFTKPGDPYWDLFRPGNQNRSSGNREALWVSQMEVDVPGGVLESSGGSYNILERMADPIVSSMQDPDGNPGFLGPRSNYNIGGRGVSQMQPTDYWTYNIWESDWDNDIRNAPHNIIRDYVYDNPASAYYGKRGSEYPSPTDAKTPWYWYPWPSKTTTPYEHPDNLYLDKDLGLLKSSAKSTYRDRYYFRLPETYFLRAEAYFRKGDLSNAADDINIVRARSHAHAIAPSEVSLDYILDERARELMYEEQRRITLQRMGKLVERVRLYNPSSADNIKDYNELWPIPFSEIESNKDVKMEQNPGY